MKETLLRLKTRFLTKYVFPITQKYKRKSLTNKDFTIISDNCWGGRIYQELGIQYLSPFVGLFIFKEDYIKLVNNLKYYMQIELVFIETSKYVETFNYPVALLEDVEIHFLHYTSQQEALHKWNSRKQRINWDNLFFKMNDSDGGTDALLIKFDSLSFSSKIIFSTHKVDNVKNLVVFDKIQHQSTIENGQDMYLYKYYFDVVEWLNNGGDSI